MIIVVVDRISSAMDGELILLPLMYSVTVTSNGHLFAESNDSIISTLCPNKNWNWPYETVSCNLQLQIDEVIVMKLKNHVNGLSSEIVRKRQFPFQNG